MTRRGLVEDGLHAFVDVIFLLLIYFMCTAAFTALEMDLDADMPVGSSTRERSRAERDLEPIRIHVLQEGGFRCNRVRCADAETLRAKLEALRAVAEVAVIIDGDPPVPFGRIVTAMDEAIGAGFANVAFAARADQR